MPQNCMSTTSTIQRKNDNCRNSVGEAPWAGRQQISGTHIYTKDWSLVNVSKQAFPTHIHTQGQLPVLNEVEMLLCLQGGRKTPTVLAKLYSGKPETQISKPEPQNCDTAVFWCVTVSKMSTLSCTNQLSDMLNDKKMAFKYWCTVSTPMLRKWNVNVVQVQDVEGVHLKWASGPSSFFCTVLLLRRNCWQAHGRF